MASGKERFHLTTVQEGHQVPVLLFNSSCFFFHNIKHYPAAEKSTAPQSYFGSGHLRSSWSSCPHVFVRRLCGASQRYLSPLLSQSLRLNEYRIKTQCLILNSALFFAAAARRMSACRAPSYRGRPAWY